MTRTQNDLPLNRAVKRVSCFLIIAFRLLPPPTFAAKADLGTFHDTMAPFLAKHCTDCHGADDPEAKLSVHAIVGDVLVAKAFKNWTEVLGSECLSGAALDRLTHRCHILETKGESYRLQEAKQRKPIR